MEAFKFLCSVCRKGVRRNSILCIKRNNWMHKRCSTKRKCLTKVVDFAFRKCSGFTGSTEVNEEVTIDSDIIEKVAKFSYR